MDSLDSYKDEILSQLLEGDWKSLFPRPIYSNVVSWFKRQATSDLVTVRFIFSHQGGADTRYAVYLLCEPFAHNGKVDVADLKFSIEDHRPLAIPPVLYEIPLYCMPADLLSRIYKKKRKP